ncbi:tetratricopeptide repeat protein [Brochothrix campestris]|uniref:tetratricopeptide repeat protein n=1 Tax=Brochothrix campestris TaxID=2757 RepID=UPI0038CF4ED0
MPDSKSTQLYFLHPTPELYFTKGTKAFEANDLPAAIKYLTRAMGLAPENTLIICQLAICYTEQADYEQSNELLNRALKLDYKPYFYYFMANNYAYLANFKQAIYYSRRYLQAKPRGEYAAVARELLRVLEERFEAEKEVEAVKPLVRERTPLELAQQQVIETVDGYLRDGYVTKAIRYLEQARLTDDLPIYAIELSVLYNRQNRKNDAKQLLNQIESQYEGHYLARCQRAVSAYYEGQWDLFKTYATELATVYPFTSHEQLEGAIVKTLARDYAGALAMFTKLNEATGSHRKFYFYASKAAYYQGNEPLSNYYWQQFGNYDYEEPYANIWLTHSQNEAVHADEEQMLLGLQSDNQVERLCGLLQLTQSTNKIEYMHFSLHFSPNQFNDLERGFCTTPTTAKGEQPSLAVANGQFSLATASELIRIGYNVTRETLPLYRRLFAYVNDQTVHKSHCDTVEQPLLLAALLYQYNQATAQKVTKRALMQQFGVSQSQLNKFIKKTQAYC